jgi:hypothetical protein
MSLTIAYLTPRYTIGRFPKEEGCTRYKDHPLHREWQRSLKISCKPHASGRAGRAISPCDGASFDSCCFMPAGRGTPLPSVATRAARAIARRLAVASDGPTSESGHWIERPATPAAHDKAGRSRAPGPAGKRRGPVRPGPGSTCFGRFKDSYNRCVSGINAKSLLLLRKRPSPYIYGAIYVFRSRNANYFKAL